MAKRFMVLTTEDLTDDVYVEVLLEEIETEDKVNTLKSFKKAKRVAVNVLIETIEYCSRVLSRVRSAETVEEFNDRRGIKEEVSDCFDSFEQSPTTRDEIKAKKAQIVADKIAEIRAKQTK